MTTIQEKWTREFRRAVTDAGLEFVTHASHANAGCWYAQQGLGTLLTICYTFDRHASFRLSGPRADERHADIGRNVHWGRPPGGQARYDYAYVPYGDGTLIAEVLQLTRQLLMPPPGGVTRQQIAAMSEERTALIAHLHGHPQHSGGYPAGHDFVLRGTQEVRDEHKRLHERDYPNWEITHPEDDRSTS